MLIKNLPPFLRKRAIANYFDPNNTSHAGEPWASEEDALKTEIMAAFYWRDSPEGFKFWNLVESGKFYHPYVLFKYLITW